MNHGRFSSKVRHSLHRNQKDWISLLSSIILDALMLLRIIDEVLTEVLTEVLSWLRESKVDCLCCFFISSLCYSHESNHFSFEKFLLHLLLLDVASFLSIICPVDVFRQLLAYHKDQFYWKVQLDFRVNNHERKGKNNCPTFHCKLIVSVCNTIVFGCVFDSSPLFQVL